MTASPHTARTIQERLRAMADPDRAEQTARFFKTGPGEYGEGDRFLGIRVPHQREVVREFRGLPLGEVPPLLESEYHEERFTGFLFLEQKFNRGGEPVRQAVIELYFDHLHTVNNWDFVDLSAPKIVGPWFEDRDREPLYGMVHSEDLWERRIAIVSTLHFIRTGELEPTFMLSDHLLEDEHDLIHKAVGWMLREAGKQDHEALITYLNPRFERMPRTMLRYAIERFDEPLRKAYLRGEVSS